ncbi:MAG: hypothetical protein IPO37_17495 [Saprospiraceae bacterium]|nr:hypothetical protein [Saprospiraceae bacterium]
MDATNFVAKINQLRAGLDYFDHFDDNISFTLKGDSRYVSESDFNNEFIRRSCVSGTYYKSKGNLYQYENEIENLIINFNNKNIFKILNGISFLDDVLILNEGLYVFGTLDSYLCYNETGKVFWIDYDTHEILSNVSNTPESFLDCMYELANNNINRSLTNIELLTKLVNLSGENDSIIFYKYLLGIDE